MNKAERQSRLGDSEEDIHTNTTTIQKCQSDRCAAKISKRPPISRSYSVDFWGPEQNTFSGRAPAETQLLEILFWKTDREKIQSTRSSPNRAN